MQDLHKTAEDLVKDIAELRDLVKQNLKPDGTFEATIDQTKLEFVVKGMIEAQRQLIIKEYEASKPLRKGEPIQSSDGERQTFKGLAESGKFKGKKIHDLAAAYNLLARAHALAPDKVQEPGQSALKEYADLYKEQAMTTTGAGSGAEVINVDIADEIWHDVFAEAMVAKNLTPRKMTADPMPIAAGWGARTWKKGTQNTAATAQDATTEKPQLKTTEQVTEVDWSYTLDEDSVVELVAELKADLTRSAAEQADNLCLNADSTNAATGNINLDDADPADDSYYLVESGAQDGIRHLYLVDNTGQSVSAAASLSDTLMENLIAKLGKYAVRPSEALIVTDIKSYLRLVALANVRTNDKFGIGTIQNGILTHYAGIPIVPSDQMPLTEADGKVSTTASLNTKGQIVLLNRRMWRAGYRRFPTLEIDRDIRGRTFWLVASMRVAIGCRGTRSTASHTAGLINITV